MCRRQQQQQHQHQQQQQQQTQRPAAQGAHFVGAPVTRGSTPCCLQITDRRSAVSRQICHSLGALAAALGPRFEWLGLALVPYLLKVRPAPPRPACVVGRATVNMVDRGLTGRASTAVWAALWQRSQL